MKNLVPLHTTHGDVGVKDVSHITYDNLNDIVYFADKTSITGYNCSSKQVEHYVTLCDQEYILADEEHCIISIHYLFDQDGLSVATTKGDLLLWQPEMNHLENVGCVDSGFTSVEWSPDQELLVPTTGNKTFVLMTKDFDAICEHNIHSEEFGEAAPMNVGWGKKETQFHGSAGKEAAKEKKPQTVNPILAHDNKNTKVSWRGDGQLFAISAVDEMLGSRFIRIYDRNGSLQATNEVIVGLENHMSWRPSGNLIACSQRKPNKHDIIFLEKNGLQHGEFTLPVHKDEKKIVDMNWNSSSDILALMLEDMKFPGNFTIQLWTVNNYHWYLKQELHIHSLSGSPPCMLWDPEDNMKLHMIEPDGSYQQLSFMYDVFQSKQENNLSMVAVIDGLKLLLTPFKSLNIPPPMSAYTVPLPSAINMVAFGPRYHQDNLVVQLSNKQFHLLQYSRTSKTYSSKNIIVDDKILQLSLRHLVWWKNDIIVAVTNQQRTNSIVSLTLNITEDSCYLQLKEESLINEDILILFKTDDGSNTLMFEDTSGQIHQYRDGGAAKTPLCLPQACCHVACTMINGENVVFGLTNHHRLLMNNKEIASNCTSFLLHDEFLLLSTHSHTLRSVYLTSLVQGTNLDDDENALCIDEAVRRVERGSKIITFGSNGTSLILQMPRGNLETIHPRALVITYLQKLLTRTDYGLAFNIMRRNRINLNLLYDHNPKLFLENVEKYVGEMDSVNYLNLFLADLTPEDVCSTLYFPYYHHGERAKDSNRRKSSTTKINIVCEAVRNALQKNSDTKNLLALLTTYAKQSPPDLETVLLKVKELKDTESGVDYDKALKYILYLVDVNQLFDIALGLYDFDVVIMVAEKSQKDPKEYLPFLNNFKNMEKNYQRYSIDIYLKKYSKALSHLVKCGDDRFDDCLAIVKDKNLHRQALKLYPSSSEQYNKLSEQYGEYLLQQKLYEDAGLIFSRSGHHEDALRSFFKSNNWNMVLTEAKILRYSDEQIVKLCRELTEKLKSERMYVEAASLLEVYVKDVEESVVCLLDGGLWFHALRLIEKYERRDLIETNLMSTMHDHYEQCFEKITELQEKFKKYETRLQVVLERKQREQYEIMEGIRDDPENDLYSDTSSITGQSVTSGTSSKVSRSTGHSRRSRAKVGRKKYSLREGGKHEDFALREAMCEIVQTIDQMKEEVSSLLKIMLLYYHDEKAQKLQELFDTCLQYLEASLKVVWRNDASTVETQCEFGPDATVQSILAQRNNSTEAKTDDLPPASRPNIRVSVRWKQHLLRS